MSNLITVLVLIFIVWQVISAILSQANSKEQESAREAAKKRREQAVNRAAGSESRRAEPGSATTAEGAHRPSRRDELAARREAQLEELRRRRQARQLELRTGDPARPDAPPIEPGGAVETHPAPSEPSPSRVQRSKRDELLRQRREEARRRQQQRDRPEPPQKQPASEPASPILRDSESVHERARIEDMPDLPPMPEPGELSRPKRGGTVDISQVRRRLHNRQSLREAVVLREVLDRPVALREPDPSF